MAELNFENMEVKRLIESLSKERDAKCQFAYQEEITKYLCSKLEPYNVPDHIIMEIAQYAMVGTLIVSNAEVREAQRYIKYEMRKGTRRRGYSSENEGEQV